MIRLHLMARALLIAALALGGTLRLATSAEAPSAPLLPPCTPRPTKVVFVNGVWNSALDSQISQLALRDALLEAGVDLPVGREYNPGDRWDLDLLEVSIYKEWERTGNAFTLPVVREELRGTNAEKEILEAAERGRDVIERVKAKIRASVRSQQRVVLVAHSQGNLIVNIALHELAGEPDMADALGNVGVVGVASPAADVAEGNSDYLTNTLDDVIAGVDGHVPGNFQPDLGQVLDPTRGTSHGFADVYLNDSITGQIDGQRTSLRKALVAKIRAMIQRVEKGTLPCPAASAATAQPGQSARIAGDAPPASTAYSVWMAPRPQAVTVDTGPARINPFVAAGNAMAWNRLVETNEDAFAQLNALRGALGLTLATRDVRLDASAAAHSNYLVLNGSTGHLEEPGKPGFTGVGPCDRMRAAGYAECAGEVLDMFAPSPGDGFTLLVDAPFHRTGLLSQYLQAGYGSKPASTPSATTLAAHHLTIDLGGFDRASRAAGSLIAFPYPGQTGVPTAWRASEVPHPAPDIDGSTVGYPITVQTGSNDTLVLSDFSLQDPSGAYVTGRLVGDYPQYRVPLTTEAMWIPHEPLKGGTRYRAKAVGTLNGRGIVLDWSFTTAPTVPLEVVFSATTLKPGTTVEATLRGADAGSSIWLAPLDPRQSALVTYSYLGPRKLVLTRNSTPCSTDCQGALGSVLVYGLAPLGEGVPPFRIRLE